MYNRDEETYDCLESLRKWQVRPMWHFVDFDFVLLGQYSENEISQSQCQSVQQYYYEKIRG